MKIRYKEIEFKIKKLRIYIIDGKELSLNESHLLDYCSSKKSVGDIAKELLITPASICMMIKKLDEKNLISIERKGKGKKTFVQTII